MRIFAALLRACPMRTARTYELMRTYTVLFWYNVAISRHRTFFITRGEAPSNLRSKSSISSAFNDKLIIVCSLDSLILLDQREGEEREIRKLQEAMRPFSNNNTERPSEMLECIREKTLRWWQIKTAFAIRKDHNFIDK